MAKTPVESVSDLARRAGASDEFVQELELHLAAHNLVDHLLVLRGARGLSQKDIADHCKCSQSKISKLENGVDKETKLGDLADYVDALGLGLEIQFFPKGQNSAGEIKHLAVRIHSLLKGMVECAHADESIAMGVSGFLGEAFFNLVGILQDNANQMPIREDGTPYIRIGLGDLQTHQRAEQEHSHDSSKEKVVVA